MENLIKGWVLSGIGFIGMVAIILHFMGIFTFPNPDFISSRTEAIIGLVACFALFLFPKTTIENWIETIIKKFLK